MNHAYVDASWQEQPDGAGLGGWGLVLLRPHELPARFQGELDAPDNNAAELRAVLEAVRAAPANQALTVHTDNQAVIACVNRGRGPALLADATRELMNEAQKNGLKLQARYAPRTGRHMLQAHLLANEARRSSGPYPLGASRSEAGRSEAGHLVGASAPHTDVLIEQRAAQPEARVSLRRSVPGGGTERVVSLVVLNFQTELPPSAQVLLAAIALAQPGERLLVRRASRVAQAIWHKPERALRPAVNASFSAARMNVQEQGIQVEFLGEG